MTEKGQLGRILKKCVKMWQKLPFWLLGAYIKQREFQLGIIRRDKPKNPGLLTRIHKTKYGRKKSSPEHPKNRPCEICNIYKAQKNSLKCESCEGVLNHIAKYLR
jgi:hypothetical protein